MTTPSAEFLKQIIREANGVSRDRSTKVGCVILGQYIEDAIFGYNSFPEGVDENVEDRHSRPAKYKWTEHAERNAIYIAARKGIRLEDAIMYLPWYPCADCARAIIQSGIREVVCYEPDWNNRDPKWAEDFKIAHQMFTEAGVVETYEVP